MPKLSIKLLGVFQATVDQQAITGFRSNKARALLAYLLAENDAPIPRAALSALLWDGYTPATAQTSLRSALLNLRQIFAPFDLFEITHRTVRVKVDSANLWCDVIALQQVWEKRPCLPPQARSALAQSVQGGFLTNFRPIDSAPFEQWRAARQSLYRQQLEQLQDEFTSRSHQASQPTNASAPTSLMLAATRAAHPPVALPRPVTAYRIVPLLSDTPQAIASVG